MKEEEVNNETTTDQPRRDRIDSGKAAPPKREQIACGQLKLCKVSHSKQCRMHGVTGDLVGFQKNFKDKTM
jgi:hypothetical protein